MVQATIKITDGKHTQEFPMQNKDLKSLKFSVEAMINLYARGKETTSFISTEEIYPGEKIKRTFMTGKSAGWQQGLVTSREFTA